MSQFYRLIKIRVSLSKYDDFFAITDDNINMSDFKKCQYLFR